MARTKGHERERFGEDARSHPLLYSSRCVRILIRVLQNLAHPVRSHSHPGSHPYPWFEVIPVFMAVTENRTNGQMD